MSPNQKARIISTKPIKEPQPRPSFERYMAKPAITAATQKNTNEKKTRPSAANWPATISPKAATTSTQRKSVNQPKVVPAFLPIRSWATNCTERPSYLTDAVSAR